MKWKMINLYQKKIIISTNNLLIKLKTIRRIISFFLILFLINVTLSCNRELYYPSMQNTPMFTEKNQYIATISTNHFQGAVSLTSHIGLCYDHTWNNYILNLGDQSEPQSSRKTNFDEFGINYYKKVKEERFFNVSCGFGLGNSTVNTGYGGSQSKTVENYKSDFNKYYLQPGYIFIKNRINMELSTRLTVTDYYNLYGINKTDTIKSRYTGINIEPAFTLKIKGKREIFNFIIQTRISTFFETQKSIGKYVNEYTRNIYLTFGIQIKLWNSLFKSKNEDNVLPKIEDSQFGKYIY